MEVAISNTQRRIPINVARLARVARCAIRALRIRTPGRLEITLIDARQMRRLNAQFLRHDRSTDVLTFRYRGRHERGPRRTPAPVTVGEILIAPSQARAYARRHGISQTEELSRYVVHGLLHWCGHEDRTVSGQARMRAQETRLLERCFAMSRTLRRPQGR